MITKETTYFNIDRAVKTVVYKIFNLTIYTAVYNYCKEI